MLFDLPSLTAAIAHEFGASYGEKVPHVYRAITGAEPSDDARLSAQDVGRVVGLLLVPDDVTACGPKVADLTGVAIELGEREIDFPPEKAKAHKLFGPWIGSSLAESLALAFAASADLSIAAASAPHRMQWSVGEIAGVLSAECVMEFPMQLGGTAVVTASFGATYEPAGVLTMRCLRGSQLARIAAYACDLTRANDAALAAVEAVEEAASTLH